MAPPALFNRMQALLGRHVKGQFGAKRFQKKKRRRKIALISSNRKRNNCFECEQPFVGEERYVTRQKRLRGRLSNPSSYQVDSHSSKTSLGLGCLSRFGTPLGIFDKAYTSCISQILHPLCQYICMP